MRAKDNMPALGDLQLFDSCMTLGRVVHSRHPRYLTADTILEVLDRYSIAEALVHEHHARLVHPRDRGNHRLLDSIRDVPRLHPVWVIEPPARPGRGAARVEVDRLLTAGVRAARLPMRAVPPLPWLWDDLCTALEEHRVPCFLDFGGFTTIGNLTDSDVNGVREIAQTHPELPLIFSHLMSGGGIHAAIVPLIRRLPNLYLDITGVLGYWRTVAREVGPERVLFATGAPFTDPSIYVSNLQYAQGLDKATKRAMCGDNLRGLLEEVR